MGLGIQIVGGPGRREFVVEMLITGKAANCRRVKADSRRPADFAVDHRCYHLTLEPS